jgi:lysozyme
MMTPEMAAKLRRSLILHEKLKHFPYTDTVGKITIGIGYNLSDRGIDDEWINKQYNADVSYFYNQLYNDFPWFKDLNMDRQIVLVDMSFMGYKHFLSFQKMLAALAKGDYKDAAMNMLDSKWAQQVKSRATQLASAMLTGVYDI